MGVGKTNAGVSGLKQYDVVCYYWGQRPSAGAGVATQARQWGCHKDYVSKSDDTTDIFTVLKDFTANVKVVGNGARNKDAGNSGRFPVTVKFYVNSAVQINGTINENGDTTPKVTTYSFKKNDTFHITGSHATNVYVVDIGFIIEIA